MQLRPLPFIQASLAGLIVAASGSSSLALTEAVAHRSPSKTSSTFIAQGGPSSSACNLDNRLLARVLRNTVLDRAYRTRSVIRVQSAAAGMSVNLNAQITTLTQAPGQFRSQVVFADPSSGKKAEYLLTSNGQQAWIYDKTGDRYSTMSSQAFDDSDDSFYMGPLANLGLTVQGDFSDMQEMKALSEAELATVLGTMMPPCQTSKLIVNSAFIDGQSYQSLGFADQEEGFTMEGLMNPQTGAIDFLKLRGSKDGIDFELNEKIFSRTAVAEVAETTFDFIPPATAQESETPISIRPF